jgi:hypothetical protein
MSLSSLIIHYSSHLESSERVLRNVTCDYGDNGGLWSLIQDSSTPEGGLRKVLYLEAFFVDQPHFVSSPYRGP